MADEGDLDNRLHPDDERDGGTDLRADRGSRGHDGRVSTKRIVKGGGAKRKTDHQRDPEGSVFPRIAGAGE